MGGSLLEGLQAVVGVADLLERLLGEGGIFSGWYVLIVHSCSSSPARAAMARSLRVAL